MTDAEILATGELCNALLTSAQFATIVAQYEQSIAADIIATKQDDKQKREDLYSSLWGTRGLLEFMKLAANAAAKITNPEPPVTTENAASYDDEGFERDDTEENDY